MTVPTSHHTPSDGREVNEWADADHARGFLAHGRDFPPHRTEGEATLLAELTATTGRVLDLGCGDGRLLDFLLSERPDASGVAVDFSEAMLDAARDRFAGDDRVRVIAHDLAVPLRGATEIIGPFDAVVSSFAIHHLTDARKQSLFAEAFDLLRPGGVFANLEHVSSPTPSLHARFRELIGQADAPEDPSNKCAPLDDQLTWIRDAEFVDVDCLWKWHELALLMGTRPRA